MYICPTCNREFQDEDKITKHLLSCWKEKHPNHISKEAPRSADRVTRTVNADIMNFFEGFKNGRSSN